MTKISIFINFFVFILSIKNFKNLKNLNIGPILKFLDQVFRYPAEHGFFCDHRASYNVEAAADAWLKVKELFQKQLHTA